MSDADEQTMPMPFDQCTDTAINDRIDAEDFNDQGWSPWKGMPHITTPQPTTKGDRNGGVLHEAPPFNFLLHYMQEGDGIERRLTCKGVLINWQLRYATCSPRNRLSFVLLVSLRDYYKYLR